MPELSQPGGPVILEMLHNRFHPAWQLFLSYIGSKDVFNVDGALMIPHWYVTKNDIHYNYNLAGGSMWGPTFWTPSHMTVTIKQVVIPDPTLHESQEKLRTREVTMQGVMRPFVWHRIDVRDDFEIRPNNGGKAIKKWSESISRKAYSYDEAGGEFAGLDGEDWWMGYRHMIKAFVKKIRGPGDALLD